MIVSYQNAAGRRAILGSVTAGARERFIVTLTAGSTIRIFGEHEDGRTSGPYEVVLQPGPTQQVTLRRFPSPWLSPDLSAPPQPRTCPRAAYENAPGTCPATSTTTAEMQGRRVSGEGPVLRENIVAPGPPARAGAWLRLTRPADQLW